MNPRRVLPLALGLAACAARVPPPRAPASVVAETTPAPSPPTTPPEAPATPRVPVAAEPRPLQDVVHLALTQDQGACAVRRDGGVWCWNGDPHTWAPAGPIDFDRPQPVGAVRVPGMGDATAVCVTSTVVCGLLRTGQVQCRGRSLRSLEATEDDSAVVSEATLPELLGTAALVEHHDRCVALQPDGRALAVAPPARPNSPWSTEVLAVPPRGCTLLDGAPRCVGANTHGLLANTTAASFGPVSPSSLFRLVTVRDVSFGEAHACAALGDGSVRCWGRNLDAQLGLGDLRSRALPTRIPGLSGVVAVRATTRATCALRSNGEVWCWGSSPSELFGEPGVTDRRVPTRVAGIDGAVALQLRSETACAVRRDGEVWCWGSGAPVQPGVPNEPWRPRAVLVAP